MHFLLIVEDHCSYIVIAVSEIDNTKTYAQIQIAFTLRAMSSGVGVVSFITPQPIPAPTTTATTTRTIPLRIPRVFTIEINNRLWEWVTVVCNDDWRDGEAQFHVSSRTGIGESLFVYVGIDMEGYKIA